ncbi:MAG TPA: hypothetical protein VMF61_03300 [Candidatus Acidoferrales bacterium]|nr:hypothetical protein [Candidatus Acidoferrales bacterium]
MNRWSIVTIAVAAAVLGGCAGGSNGASSVLPVSAPAFPNATGAQRPAPELSLLPDLSSFFPHLRRHRHAPALRAGDLAQASSIKTLEIYADLYPSYASDKESYRDFKMAAPKGAIHSITVSFPDAPVGNNEFATFEVDALGSGGSYYYLGDVGAIVNVTKPGGVKVTADAQTTLPFQAEMSMIDAGLFTANDLKSAGLLATVEARIASEKLEPDPYSGIFTQQTIDKFVGQWAPAWRQTVTLTTGTNVDKVTYTNDVSDMAENLLRYNETDFLVPRLPDRPEGAPCYTEFTYDHTLGGKRIMEPESCTDYVYAPAGNTISKYVYRGPVLVGQLNDETPPYTASLTHLPAAPPKTTKNLGSISLMPAQDEIKADDPFDWAFGTRPALYSTYTPQPSMGNDPSPEFVYSLPAGWSKADPDIAVLAWDPAGLPLSAFHVCTWRQSCVALGSSKTLAIDPPFSDPGTNFKYYKYTGSPGVSQTSDPVGGCTATSGYHWSYPGTSFSLTTTKPVWLSDADTLYFNFNSGGTCSPDPLGMTITVTAVGTNGKTYVNSATNNYETGSEIALVMDSILQETPLKSLKLTFTGAPTGALDFDILYNNAGLEP